jgi:quercetin dioxygenase-like cupin family protein
MAIIIHGEIAQTKGYYSKILNRTLVDGEQGAQTCALWEQTLPIGGFITPHYHDYEETLTILSGTAEVVIEKERTTINSSTTIFIPANTVHSMRNTGEDPIQLLAFHATPTPQVHYLETPKTVEWEAT